jgi:cytochrome c1
LAFLAACSTADTSRPTSRPSPDPLPRQALTPAPNVPGDPATGRRLFLTAGCGGCHTLTDLPTATGVAGPNLANVTLRPTLAGDAIPMTPDFLARFLLDPAAVKPDSTMPNLGLTAAEARDLAAYLYSQPHNTPN